MEHTKVTTILLMHIAAVLCLGSVGLAEPVGTAFTYQGRLIDANQAADGLYDFQFKLFDGEADGNQLGPDMNNPEVDVIDGYFTAQLDFDNVFDGNERWLEIGVRPGEIKDPNVFTILSPRQKITPTPYAISVLNGGSGSESLWQLNGTSIYYNNGNVGIGTSNPACKLSVNGDVNISSVYRISGDGVLAVSNELCNTFVGISAGYSDTTGWNNTFFGRVAGAFNTTGYDNTFSGNNAGYSNIGGFADTFFGSSAGISNTSGYNNTFLGNSAGYSNTEGFANTFLGSEAGFSNTTGLGNVFLGNQAGYNETGSNKLYIANSSANPPLIYGDFSSGRIGIGTSDPKTRLHTIGAISSGWAGFNSPGTITFFPPDDCAWFHIDNGPAGGRPTGRLRISAGNNPGDIELMSILQTGNVGIGTAIPASKLGVNGDISAASNYKIGSNTVLSIAGTNNTLIGGLAGINNTGSSNTFSGWLAGYQNTTGSYNTFTGMGAGYSNTEGGENIFSGYYAGFSNSTGGANIFLGNLAGYSNTTAYYNTFVGFAAGYSNTTGSSNTFLGRGAGTSNTTGSGNVFVGYEAGFFETGSNKLYIANSTTNPPLIYGDFSSKYVGINTTAPARNLHINDVMRLQPRATAPSSPAEGDIYYSSTSHTLMVYNGTTWMACF